MLQMTIFADIGTYKTNFMSNYLLNKCDRETNCFCLQKKQINQIEFRHKIGNQSDRKSQKCRASPQNLPIMPKDGSALPRIWVQ